LCWLHSVGQNHLYVMLLLSQGCCFIQSLLFSYVLQEDSVKFLRKFISVPCQPSGRSGIPSGHSLVSNIHPDDENFPSGRPSVSRSFEQFKVASIGHNGKSSERYSEFKKNPAFKCIRPDDVAIPSGHHSVFDKH
jgi:hypothetical protein